MFSSFPGYLSSLLSDRDEPHGYSPSSDIESSFVFRIRETPDLSQGWERDV